VEATVRIADVRTFDTKGGNTRFVIRDEKGNEYTTFREQIGAAARAADGKRARIEYHEQQRGEYTNVYLDAVELLADDEADGDDRDPEEAAWRTAVDAAPWLVGSEDSDDVDAEEMFEKLKPFKDRVAEDIRDDG